MSREVKRVPLDFDWPVGRVWLGYMDSICSEDVDYIMSPQKLSHDEKCEVCRHAARLAGIEIKSYGCPNWKFDPPKGDGWQMWETVTEGSPMSPVFSTPEELAHWLAGTRASAFGSITASYEDWLRMIWMGWAPGTVMAPGKKIMISGVEFIANEKKAT